MEKHGMMKDSTDEEEEEKESEIALPAAERLLKHSRNGCTSEVKIVLENAFSADPSSSLINCRGTSKANRDWTPLHLSCYFGHTSVVDVLLQNGADVNAINDKGDTPLHKAAYTGRLDAVTILLKHDADVNIRNSGGETALAMAKSADIKKVIEAAHKTEMGKLQKEFLLLATQGQLQALENLIRISKNLNVNCVDDHGNTALHLAAYRDCQQMAAFLMQAGINSQIKNSNGELAIDIATSSPMKKILEVTPLHHLTKSVQRFDGPILKKSKILGFKRKYIILDRGVLTVFNTLADASSGTKRRTYRYLDDAKCLVSSRDNLGFALIYNDHTSHIFRVESGIDEAITRQRWVNALVSHIEYSTHYMHKGVSRVDDEEVDLLPLGSISNALQTAQAHQSSLERDVKQLTTLVGSLLPQSTKDAPELQETIQKCSTIARSSHDTCHVLTHCLALLTQQEELRAQQLADEKERCRVLQDSLRVLAVQHLELEQQFSCNTGYHSPVNMSESGEENSDDEFFDCEISEALQVSQDEDSLSARQSYPPALDSKDESASSQQSYVEPTSDQVQHTDLRKVLALTKRSPNGRSQLPVPMLSKNEFSVWSILKQCIGKELSKITMPVVFNEPLSFLQRLAEYMEYSYLLERANACESSVERMAYVAAFAVSACASNWDRLGKPFNPLLGETYELDKKELGYKMVCEQVSHHPPISAFHVTGDEYKFYGAINPKLRFWGKSVEITPKGMVTIELTRHGETYTWENVNCAVHNIIVGKLWVEHHGQMEIINHNTGHRAEVTFKKSNLFNRDAHRIEGCIYDNKKQRLQNLYGSWTDSMFCIDPQNWDAHLKQTKPTKTAKLFDKNFAKLGKSLSVDDSNGNEVEDEVPKRLSTFDLSLPGQTFLWQADNRPDDCDKYYSFTRFAMMLNELQENIKDGLCPTDSRSRPDIRCLEMGNIDDAAEKKMELEEKQRNTRKKMKKNKEEWSTRWFDLLPHPITGKEEWIYKGRYWDRDWSASPDIF